MPSRVCWEDRLPPPGQGEGAPGTTLHSHNFDTNEVKLLFVVSNGLRLDVAEKIEIKKIEEAKGEPLPGYESEESPLIDLVAEKEKVGRDTS